MERLNTVDEVKSLGKNIFEKAIEALNGDRQAQIELGIELLKSPASIKMILFHYNFERFISGMNHSQELMRKFLEFLNNENMKSENAKRILLLIDQSDSDIKVEALINLTKSVSYGFITKREYFFIGKIINNSIDEDLEYIKQNLRSGELEYFDLTDDFVRSGLMYITEDGNYAYSKLAYNLDKYALSYADDKYKYNGEPDYVPRRLPNKQPTLIGPQWTEF